MTLPEKEIPKTRGELANELAAHLDMTSYEAEMLIRQIEAYGLRIVPTELTQTMHDAMWKPIDLPWRHRCQLAIAASPFAPKEGSAS